MPGIITFGEIMGRLTPEGLLRFQQAMPGRLEITFAGAEANVAASIAQLGGRASFVSAVPLNAIGDACLASLRTLGVDTREVLLTNYGRLGLYFLETGANQRPSNVIYDRDGSSIALTPPEAYPWKEILREADWLHVTGITPALSQTAAGAAQAAVEAAKATGVTVSCDLNFRGKLWRWDLPRSARDLAEETMRKILPSVDLVIGNEADAADVLGIRAAETDVESGKLAIDRYPDVARQIVEQFGNVSRVAITLRESISASHNNWGAMLYDAGQKEAFFAPTADGAYRPYEIRNIVDRVGGGDAFAGALIYALTTAELSAPQTAAAFAAAASCLAHSIRGDCNYTSRAEAESLMKGSGSGRVVR